MKVVTDPAALLMRRLLRLLRWRLWIQERLQPSEWQVTLFWAAVAGSLGALSSIIFTLLTERVHDWFGNSSLGVVHSMAHLPWWGCLLVPTVGGALAGAVLVFGPKLARGQSSTDINMGGDRDRHRPPAHPGQFDQVGGGAVLDWLRRIDRAEGPMVQLAAVVASQLGRWQKFTPPKLRLLVACGAAAGIASAYNAPIAGSFFVAEIILGTIAMESLGPLVVSAVAATLTIHVLTAANVLYRVPPFGEVSPLEMGPYILLGFVAGGLAPLFLVSLKKAEGVFVALKLPIIARLALGGLAVGVIAINVPKSAATVTRWWSKCSRATSSPRRSSVTWPASGWRRWRRSAPGRPGVCSRRRCSWARARASSSARRCITSGRRSPPTRSPSPWSAWGPSSRRRATPR